MEHVPWLLLATVVVVVVVVNVDGVKQFKPAGESVIMRKLLDNYHKQEPPLLDRPTEVRLGIYVNSFYSISEQTMDYTLNMYLRQTWQDPRLKFSSPDGTIKEIKMFEGYWQHLWLPDVFFRNEKQASYHDVTVLNRMLRVNASGQVWYTVKISATLSCPMKLHKYPLDTQICPMMFESFGYTMDTMYFSWIDKPVDIDKNLQLPQFFLVDSLMFDCSQNYTAGAFPCLSIQFILRRDIGYFLIQVYVPSILIVILSWVSFWINIDASPARVSLGLLTVLTTTTMSGGARESLPRVSYIKAIDVWMIICLVFVFASLIEYAVVNVAARHQTRPNVVVATATSASAATPAAYRMPRGFVATGPRTAAGVASSNADGHLATRVRQMTDRLCDLLKLRPMTGDAEPNAGPRAAPSDSEASKRRARGIDKLSRRCFPTAFVAFNIVYWIIYTRQEDMKAIWP